MTVKSTSTNPESSDSRIPSPKELIDAARADIRANRKLQEKIKQYATVFRSRSTELDLEIKKQIKLLVDESVGEIQQIEAERADTIRQLSDLHDIRTRLSEAIQSKNALKHRAEAELQRRKTAAQQRKQRETGSGGGWTKSSTVSRRKSEFNAEPPTSAEHQEYSKLLRSINLLKEADHKIQQDMDVLYEDKETLEYVLDSKKTRSTIDTELLNARYNFEFRNQKSKV